MLSATEVNSLVNFEFVTPANDEPTFTQDLVPTRSVTLLLDELAAVDLMLGHIAPTYSVVSTYPNFDLTMRDMESWDHLLQRSLKEDNGDLHAHDYHIVQTISPFYMHFPTCLCAWFVTGPGHLRRAFPIIFLCLKKPICCEEGYVIYQFTCDLFSRSPNPESLEPPTNLIAILEYHTHEEAAHLKYEISTLHQ
ncbi:hypothetical protein PILCRDRAFT_7647 [Piloderma croceum F 1598]|uniref:Uncharacterized protein n=1 Tax=Piloderma croceum (strain F 1598) TaxID=765440 RepID=A0A0C3FW18_PILCF|nr:hypothetical protein PILCRDRAFT_7647 [Piloderma croceum F 1598]